MKKRITVIGLGYVGLPTLLILSENEKYITSGYDNDQNKIKLLKEGSTNLNEKEIHALLKKNLKNKNLIISDKINESEVFIICVPSNINKKLRQNFLPLFDSINKIINAPR